jgi:uncharacterized protein YqfA (UPF0365 family)
MITFWILAVIAVGLCVLLFLVSGYLSLWLQARLTGADIRMWTLLMMSLRKVDPRMIVRSKVMAAQAGLPDIPTNELEALFLAGGDVPRVILALIAASRANIDLEWDTAAAIDLAGRDVLEAVQTSVIPKVILCPIPTAGSADTLYGVAKDGIQLKVRVLVTVRTNLQQLIGGATESTVIARVGQGIVAAIGACENYREALADPALISRQVTAKGLDSQTAFAIVSIDIADIDVGENVGARLRMDQANADIRIARAAAEARRTMAVAQQQEMFALVKEQQAHLIEAEALIPPALALAFHQDQEVTDSSSTASNKTAVKIWRMVD